MTDKKCTLEIWAADIYKNKFLFLDHVHWPFNKNIA